MFPPELTTVITNVCAPEVAGVNCTVGSSFIPSTAESVSAIAGFVTSKTVDSAGDAVSLRLLSKVLAVDSVILDVSVKPLLKSNSLFTSVAVTGSGSTSASDKSKSILEVNAFTFDCTAVTESVLPAGVISLAVDSVTVTVSSNTVVTSKRSIASEVVAVSVTFLWGLN